MGGFGTQKKSLKMELDKLHETNMWCIVAVSERLNTMIAEIPAVVSGEDTDSIRRTRVASRRLGTALNILGSKLVLTEMRPLERRVRKIRRLLGMARDLDVQIQSVSAFQKESEEKRFEAGIARLLLRLKQRRGHIQPAILKTLAQIEKDGILARFSEQLHRAQIRYRMQDGKVDFAATRQIAFEVLHLRLQVLCSLAPFLKIPTAVTQQHRMRVEAKRLRYAMEIFKNLYDNGLDIFIQTIKTLQDHLGALHDADIWIETIPLFVEDEKNRTLEYFGNTKNFSRLLPGLQYIQKNQQDLRSAVYEKTALFWREMEEDGLLKRLECLLSEWNDRDNREITEVSGDIASE